MRYNIGLKKNQTTTTRFWWDYLHFGWSWLLFSLFNKFGLADQLERLYLFFLLFFGVRSPNKIFGWQNRTKIDWEKKSIGYVYFIGFSLEVIFWWKSLEFPFCKWQMLKPLILCTFHSTAISTSLFHSKIGWMNGMLLVLIYLKWQTRNGCYQLIPSNLLVELDHMNLTMRPLFNNDDNNSSSETRWKKKFIISDLHYSI